MSACPLNLLEALLLNREEHDSAKVWLPDPPAQDPNPTALRGTWVFTPSQPRRDLMQKAWVQTQSEQALEFFSGQRNHGRYLLDLFLPILLDFLSSRVFRVMDTQIGNFKFFPELLVRTSLPCSGWYMSAGVGLMHSHGPLCLNH